MIPQHGELQISAKKLAHNLQYFRVRLSPETQLCATLKANAYGHGIAPMANLLTRQEIRWACVYTLAEARQLADLTPAMRILVLAPAVFPQGAIENAASIANLLSAHLEQLRLTITDQVSADALAKVMREGRLNSPLSVHMQIDTGLTRSGTSVEEAAALIAKIESLPSLKLEGIFSHFSHGEVPDHPTLSHQHEKLWSIAAPVKKRRPDLLVHLQNSGGACNLPKSARPLDMVRLGIAMYGLQPSLANPIAELQPIARLVAPILAIHDRPAGTGVGYGHTFTTTRPSRLAIVPVGYADGYPRSLSNRALVQIQNQTAPVVGRVSMDQIIVDVTDIPMAAVGDHVILISENSQAPNCVDQIAKTTCTIGYEIITQLGTRISRYIVE